MPNRKCGWATLIPKLRYNLSEYCNRTVAFRSCHSLASLRFRSWIIPILRVHFFWLFHAFSYTSHPSFANSLVFLHVKVPVRLGFAVYFFEHFPFLFFNVFDNFSEPVRLNCYRSTSLLLVFFKSISCLALPPHLIKFPIHPLFPTMQT